MVIVREGYGATGLKDSWSTDQLAAGKIPFRLGHFYRDEVEALDKDHALAKLPVRPPQVTENGEKSKAND